MDSKIVNRLVTFMVSIVGAILSFVFIYISFIFLNWIGIKLSWNYIMEGMLFVTIFKNWFMFLINK